MWKSLIGALGLASLVGCASVVGDLKGVAYDDALSYVRENHDIRKDYRAKKEAVIDARYQAYLNAAAVALNTQDVGTAEAMWDKAISVLADNYRDLATIEAIRKGIDDFAGFRRAIENAE